MYYQKYQWGRGVDTAWKYNEVVHKTRFLEYGNYNSRIFYAPNEKACVIFLNYYKTNSTHALGIKNQGFFGHLTYCA